ncbi:hypothetical protein ACP275_08G093600 [Erythranthe tilingii]
MVKLTLGIVTLTVLVLLAAAATATRTTTTVEIVNVVAEESSQAQQGCGQEIERQRLSSCREYLTDSSRFVPENEGGRGWLEEFPRCCEELQQISQHCRCQAVKQVAQEQRQEGRLQGREIREMLKTAQSLPTLCRISSHYCQNLGGRDPL